MYKKRTLAADIGLFCKEVAFYTRRKVLALSLYFEAAKNFLVLKLLWRRGVLSRQITHVSLLAFSLAVVFVAIVFGRTGVFSSSTAAAKQALVTKLSAPIAQEDSVLAASVIPITQISDKPRDQIIEHEVKPGETISQIAEKYEVDTNTIRWANELSDVDKLSPGQKLKILPVSGVAYQVQKGDTIYSVAEKYRANPQAIADWQYNMIDETLKLQAGQTLMIPDGVPPTKPAPTRPAPVYVAQGTKKPVKEGADDRTPDQKKAQGPLGFIWPIAGQLTQYFTRFHTGVDIAGSIGTPVVAAGGGKVVFAQKQAYGYGWHVIIDHGNGYQTLYGHLSRIDVNEGQTVGQGQTVGLRGSTGRSTGPHLHFEVRKNGGFQNPLSYLK